MGGADGWMDRLRTGEVCFDATVPRHMVSAGLGDYLAPFAGRSCWPMGVEAELNRASFPNKSSVIGGRFAKIIELSDELSDAAEDLRLESLTRAERRAKLTKNRGEAECVIYCESTKTPLVIHDELGREWARRRGVQVFTTIDILCVAVRCGLLKPGAAWRAYERMCQGANAMIPLAPYPPGTSGRGPFLTKAAPLYSLYEAERSAGRG